MEYVLNMCCDTEVVKIWWAYAIRQLKNSNKKVEQVSGICIQGYWHASTDFKSEFTRNADFPQTL